MTVNKTATVNKALVLAVLADRNATVAEISWQAPGGKLESFTGSAKREPGDLYHPEIAMTLAASRALREMADQLERRARAAVDQGEKDKLKEHARIVRARTARNQRRLQQTMRAAGAYPPRDLPDNLTEDEMKAALAKRAERAQRR